VHKAHAESARLMLWPAGCLEAGPLAFRFREFRLAGVKFWSPLLCPTEIPM